MGTHYHSFLILKDLHDVTGVLLSNGAGNVSKLKKEKTVKKTKQRFVILPHEAGGGTDTN